MRRKVRGFDRGAPTVVKVLLAVVFPTFVVAIAWAVTRPASVVPPITPGAAVDRTPTKSKLGTRMAMLAVSYFVMAAAGVAQHYLLLWAKGNEDWWFHVRATDAWVHALLVGLVAGLGVSAALILRYVGWRNRHQLAAMADRPGLDGFSLRQETVIVPRIVAALTVAATLFNAASFDTFLQIGRGYFRYSQPFSPWTYERRAAEIRELRGQISQRRNGVEKQSLTISMMDGEGIDASSLIEQADIIPVIDFLNAGSGRRLLVRYVR